MGVGGVVIEVFDEDFGEPNDFLGQVVVSGDDLLRFHSMGTFKGSDAGNRETSLEKKPNHEVRLDSCRSVALSMSWRMRYGCLRVVCSIFVLWVLNRHVLDAVVEIYLRRWSFAFDVLEWDPRDGSGIPHRPNNQVPLTDQWLVQGVLHYRLEGVDKGDERALDFVVVDLCSLPADGLPAIDPVTELLPQVWEFL